MFTGIVEDLGRVVHLEDAEGLRRFTLRSDICSDGVRVGDSIAVNGACLTAVSVAANEISVEAIPETLRLTNLGQLAVDSLVNLERPLAYGDRIGGHYVQGHVDATAELIERQPDGESEVVRFTVPSRLMQYIVSKGFVALDGVSLTVVDPRDATFAVALIPHTIRSVTLGAAPIGYRANLEADILAKYGSVPEPEDSSRPSIAQLRAAGYRLDATR
ncbi:MAG: riboflavin synthase [Chloroflexi bacterium]|nr:riboflavin synthase [Chloroflexota bacterium]